MAADSQYNDSDRPDNGGNPYPDKWQHIGDLIHLAFENNDFTGVRLGLNRANKLVSEAEEAAEE